MRLLRVLPASGVIVLAVAIVALAGAAPGGLTSFSLNVLAFSGDGTKLLISDQSTSPIQVRELDTATGATTLVSSDDSGVPGNGESLAASFSEDGSKVVFVSRATNLDAADTDTTADVYVKDLTTGDVKLVSTSSAGVKAANTLQTNGLLTFAPAISADGSTVAWASNAANLGAPAHCRVIDMTRPPAPPGTGPFFTACDSHVFVKRLDTGAVTVADTSDTGVVANAGFSGFPLSLSANGDRIAFGSSADNLAAGSGPGLFVKDITDGHVFALGPASDPTLSHDGKLAAYSCAPPPGSAAFSVICTRDLTTGVETVITPTSFATTMDHSSLSGDGSHVAFDTTAALLPADDDSQYDVYVIDLATGALSLGSVDASGNNISTGGDDAGPHLSTDAKRVLFHHLINVAPGGDFYVLKELGGAQATLDANGDGVADSLQPSGTAVGAFTDLNVPPTTGSIVDAGGLTMTVSDAAAPDGVRVQVGPGTGSARLSVCGGFTLKVAAGSSVVVTCGSVRLSVATGQAQIVLTGGTVVTFPAGSQGKVTAHGDGFDIANLGTVDLTLTTGGTSTSVTAGGSTTLDTTPPSVTPSVSGTVGANNWYTSDVAVSWNVSDSETQVTKSGCDPLLLTTDTASLTLTCVATSGGGTTTKQVTIKRDATAPSIVVGSHPAYYTVDQTVSISCTSTDTTSGIATGCQPIDAPAYTFTLGANTRSFSATDKAGNTGSVSTGFSLSVTAASLCQLTKQFVQSPAANGACQKLTAITSTPKQKAALVAAYKNDVAALVKSNALRPAQASVLTGLADSL